MEPNLWMANAPGSTVFMPIADASEQVLALLAMAIGWTSTLGVWPVNWTGSSAAACSTEPSVSRTAR
jgi:hypothetical protein